MQRIAIALLCTFGLASAVQADVYENPKISVSGTLRGIWGRTTAEAIENTNRFCQANNDGEYIQWVRRCGSPSTPYADWNSTAWRTITSGTKKYSTCDSSNGYHLVGIATCGFIAPTATVLFTPGYRIWAPMSDPLKAGQHARQACAELGKPDWISYHWERRYTGVAATLDPVWGWVEVNVANGEVIGKLICSNVPLD